MPDSSREKVSYANTPVFRKWLKDKGYDWDRMSWRERERAFAEEMREGLAQARKVD